MASEAFAASAVSPAPPGELAEIDVELTPPVKARAREVFERSLFFVSDRVRAFRLQCDEQGNVGSVRLTAEGDPAPYAGKVKRLAAELRGFRGAAAREVWRSQVSRPASDVSAELLRRGWLHLPATGLATLGGPLLRLFRYLDDRIAALVGEQLGATEYQYPTLVPTEIISSTHYLENFPHLLFFVTRLHSDIDVYASCGDRAKSMSMSMSAPAPATAPADGLSWVLPSCGAVEYCLPPTMCFHTYHQLRGQVVPAPGRVFTARGKSFRFESRYQKGLERLFDFTIRETVFIGERSFVTDYRARMLDLLTTFVDELGLKAAAQVASDPFFANTNAGAMAASQQVLEQKVEITAPVGGDRQSAVGSVNLHGDFFGKNFQITDGAGRTVESSCCGVGLERLTYAFVCQHGPDPAGWPEAVRRRIGSDVGSNERGA
jgi:seryl-tRNA synthetase